MLPPSLGIPGLRGDGIHAKLLVAEPAVLPSLDVSPQPFAFTLDLVLAGSELAPVRASRARNTCRHDIRLARPQLPRLPSDTSRCIPAQVSRSNGTVPVRCLAS